MAWLRLNDIEWYWIIWHAFSTVSTWFNACSAILRLHYKFVHSWMCSSYHGDRCLRGRGNKATEWVNWVICNQLFKQSTNDRQTDKNDRKTIIILFNSDSYYVKPRENNLVQDDFTRNPRKHLVRGVLPRKMSRTTWRLWQVTSFISAPYQR